MNKLFVVGDIHGKLEDLRNVMSRIDSKYSEGDLIVFLGDYVDRGNDSCGVLDELIKLKNEYNCIFLMGNHDYELLKNVGYFCRLNIESYSNWSARERMNLLVRIEFLSRYQVEALISFLNRLGNSEDIDTVMYYKRNLTRLINHDIDLEEFLSNVKKLINVFQKIEDNFLEQLLFLSNCRYYVETDKYIISHSGGNKDKKIEDNTKEEWVWSRDYVRKDSSKYFIVGHTPTQSGEVEVNDETRHIFVDTGAVFRGIDVGIYESTFKELK